MPSVAVLPSLGPFGRVVDVRVFGHGFAVLGSKDPSLGGGKGIVRPNMSSNTWYARPTTEWAFGAGNNLWSGTWTPHRVSFRGLMGRQFGALTTTDADGDTVHAYRSWVALDGRKMSAPGLVIGACIKDMGDERPVEITEEPDFGAGLLVLSDPPALADAPPGEWQVLLTSSGWDVRRPDGQSAGVATPGMMFDGPLRFVAPETTGLALGAAYKILVDDVLQVYVITDADLLDRVWRKGLGNPAAPFRFVGSIGRPEGESLFAPWAINDTGTLAAVVRGARLVEVDLDTLARADTDITQPNIAFTYFGDGSSETWTTPDPKIGEALKGVEFIGADRYEYWISYAAELSGSAGESGGGGGTAMTVDFQVRKNGSVAQSLRLLDYAATVAKSISPPAPPSYVGSQLTATSRAIFWFHPMVPVSEWAYAEASYISTPGATQLMTGWLGGITCTVQSVYGCAHREQGEINVYSGGSLEASGIGDYTGVYDFFWSNDTGDVGLGCHGSSSRGPQWLPGLGYNSGTGELSEDGSVLINPNGQFSFSHRNAVGGSAIPFAVGHNGAGGYGLGPNDGWPLNFVTNPSVAPPGVPGMFNRSAADERGNYIHCTQLRAAVHAEFVGVGSSWASQGGAALSGGTDRKNGGLVPVVGSWRMSAGGPDLLTPTIVHNLTSESRNDLWEVGVF